MDDATSSSAARLDDPEAYYRDLYESAPIAYMTVGRDGKVREANRRAAELLGRSQPLPEGEPVLSLYADTPAGRVRAEALFERFHQGHEIRDEELEMQREGGGTVWVSLTVRPVFDAKGRVAESRSMAVDITARKRAEEELRESEAKFRCLLEYAPHAIVVVDERGRIETVNEQTERMFGYAKAHLLGSTLEVLIPNRFRAEHAAHRADYAAEPAPRPMGAGLDLFARRSDGSEVPVDISLSPAKWNGRVLTICNIQDISDRRQLEAMREHVHQQAKLSAVGQLAAGIAHDFNNILTAIVGTAHLVELSPDFPSSMKGDLTVIQTQSERAARLIRQILDFTRASPVSKGQGDLRDYLDEVVNLLERMLPDAIRVVQEMGAGPHLVYADRARIEEMVMNLAVNARDAMPHGGTLRLGLSRLHVKPGTLPPASLMGPGAWVVLTVSDTGTGMPQDVVARIFEPFFTTKRRGEGTGLGLAQVHGIVHQHGGTITVDSRVGQGTTFRIYLPEAAPSEGPPHGEGAEPRDSPVPSGGGETILVVEDDPAVRVSTRRILEALGYRVLAAGDGVRALELHAVRPDVDLVLTDVDMPNMGGIELFEALMAKGADTRVLTMTGYPPNSERLAGLRDAGLESIEKPFNVSRLARAVERALKS